MTATARPLPIPTFDAAALRAALAELPGIVEVRATEGAVWVVRDGVDVDRDCRLAGVLAEALPPEVEFQTATVARLHMVPDGVRIV